MKLGKQESEKVEKPKKVIDTKYKIPSKVQIQMKCRNQEVSPQQRQYRKEKEKILMTKC